MELFSVRSASMDFWKLNTPSPHVLSAALIEIRRIAALHNRRGGKIRSAFLWHSDTLRHFTCGSGASGLGTIRKPIGYGRPVGLKDALRKSAGRSATVHRLAAKKKR
jgi:hypothetical protein